MTERRDLTYEEFLSLAHQQGLYAGDGHLEELFPEVQAMIQRITLLDEVDTSAIGPVLASNITRVVTFG